MKSILMFPVRVVQCIGYFFAVLIVVAFTKETTLNPDGREQYDEANIYK